MKTAIRYACAALALVAASPSYAAQVILNGDFSAGLANWTSFITSNGTISPSNPNSTPPFPNAPAETASFNVTGAGASNALWLNAGQSSGFGLANPGGGGVSQTFTTTGGIGTLSANIASMTTLTSQTDVGGLFSILLDGTALATYDFGAINGTQRSTLSYTGAIAAGTHTLSLQVLRPFGPGRNIRAQYFDNVSLDVAAPVPEASTWAMMIVGMGAVGGALRRRKVTARVSYVA